jgi:hypothetical protein
MVMVASSNIANYVRSSEVSLNISSILAHVNNIADTDLVGTSLGQPRVQSGMVAANSTSLSSMPE